MRRNQLLFTKQDNPEKSTTLGENSKNSNEIFLTNKTNNNEEEQTFSYEVKSINNLENENINIVDLGKELEELKQKLKEERVVTITKINELNSKDIEKGKEMKNSFNNLVKLIQKLKKYDKNLTIKTKFLTKMKTQNNEEEIKNNIKLKEAQIKVNEKRLNYIKTLFEKSEKNQEKEKNREEKLQITLTKLKSELSMIESKIQKLQVIYDSHLKCEKEKKLLNDKYNMLETDYKYELKRAEQLAKIKIKEKDEEDAIIEEEFDQLDEKAKAEKLENSILPKLKVLKFRGENIVKLERKIIQINKIGIYKNEPQENAKKLYKKIDNIYKDKNRYITKANSFIRKNRKINIDYEDNYLFSENDAKIMEKIMPEKMLNSYQNKFNDILQQKIEAKKNLDLARSKIMNKSSVILNKFDYKIFELKIVQADKIKLMAKSQKLKEKANDLKRNIKEVKERIKKEENKIRKKEIDKKRINLYYKNLNKKTQTKKNDKL